MPSISSTEVVGGAHSNPASDASQIVSDTAVHPPATWLNGGIAVVDAGGKIVNVNDSLAIWLGQTPGELTGKSLPDLIGQRHAGWRDELRNLLAQPAAFDRIDLVAGEKDSAERLGVELCAHGAVRFIRLESGVPPARELENLFPENSWGSVAIHKAFQRMLRAEVQLDNLIHRWPGIIFSQRPDFSFAFISPRIEELTGVPAAGMASPLEIFLAGRA